MKKPILYVDMDEVIASFKKEMIRLHPHTHELFGQPESLELSKEFEACMLLSPRMFRHLEPIEGSIETVTRLSEHFEVYFLSTPFWELPESFTDKRLWLEDHFGELAYKRLILSHRKDLNIGDYLVDDRLANGSEKFTGEHLHFGQKEFPDWASVEKYLMR